MKRGAWILGFMSAIAGACKGESPETSDASTTSSTSQTGGSTGVPTSGGDSVSVSSSAVTTSEATTEPPSGSATFEPIDCGEALLELPIPTPGVMLVLDKSGSMVADPGGFWDHDNDPNTPTITRWNSLHSVVEQVLGDFGNSMNLGAVLFPSTAATASYSEAACVVSDAAEVPIAPMNAAAILGVMPGALDAMLEGATPATRGLKLAIQALADAPADQPRVLILVTDGAANCQEKAPDTSTLLESYDDKVTETVAAALAMGIQTYVVGIGITQGVSDSEVDSAPDNVDTYEKLNALALAGGTARPGVEKFFNATDQDQLEAALETISMALVPCVLTLVPSPTYPYYVEIAPYGKDEVEDCLTEDGWMYLPKLDPGDPKEPLRIELCGAACSDYRMRGEVDIKYGCPVG